MGSDGADTASGEAVPEWACRLSTAGSEVWVPREFEEWGPEQREGFLAEREVCAAEGRVLRFAYSCVERAGAEESESGDGADPWETAESALGAAMAMSRGRAGGVVRAAVELVERLPRVAVLVWGGWIGLEAVRAIVAQTSLVSDEAIAAVDRALAERLGPSRRRSHPPRIGPLKRMLGRLIMRADPVGAEAAARQARDDGDVRLDPVGRDQAALTAWVPAEVGVEIMERVEAMARTAAEGDPRTLAQRRVAGLLALTRGWDRLPDPDGNLPGDPGALGSVRKVVLHAFEASKGAGVPVELRGYGPVTRATVEELEVSARRRIEEVAELGSRERAGALRYAPSEGLRLFCQGRDGTCVFPGCQVEAERCDLDHAIPFDHARPGRGGRTTSDDLAALCRGHHRLKTAGIWAYYRDVDGSYVWLHGPAHPHPEPGTRVRVEPSGPLASMAAPVDPGTTDRQRAAAEAGRTGGSSGNGTVSGRGRPHRRARLEAERRRLRSAARGRRIRPTVRPSLDGATDDAPPY